MFLFTSASCSLGAAQASIEAAREQLEVRKQFGSYLKDFQVGICSTFPYLLLCVVIIIKVVVVVVVVVEEHLIVSRYDIASSVVTWCRIPL